MERSYHPAGPFSNNSRRISNGVYNELQVIDDDGIFSRANRKKSISQYCAVFSVCVICLNFGVGFSYTTILIPELKRNDTEIPATESEISWISSMNVITIPLGAVVSGPLAQLLGRRLSLMLATLAFMAIWLVLFYANSIMMIYIGLLSLGVTSGLVESPVQVYVMETCEPRVRGSGSASLSAAFALGLFLEIIIGSHVYWRTLALVNLVPLLVSLVALFVVPETPHWLASKGRVEEARRALGWLRGWASSSHVDDEYQATLEYLATRRNEEKRASFSRTNSVRSFFKRFFRYGVMRPFALISIMFVISQFNGQSPIMVYAVSIFEVFKCSVNEYTVTTIMAGCYLIGIVVSVYVVATLGKRIPTIASLFVGGVATMVVAVYEFMYKNNIMVTDENYISWIPVGGIIISVVATAVGIKVTPWILAGEIFPADVRGLAAGLIGAICNIFGAIANKTYQDMIDNVGYHGTFFIYAMVNFIGCVVLYFIMPDTEGMTLAEIETLFSGVDNFNNKKNNKENEMSAMDVKFKS